MAVNNSLRMRSGYKHERNGQERREQENEGQEQFAPRERHREDADAERQVIVG